MLSPTYCCTPLAVRGFVNEIQNCRCLLDVEGHSSSWYASEAIFVGSSSIFVMWKDVPSQCLNRIDVSQTRVHAGLCLSHFFGTLLKVRISY